MKSGEGQGHAKVSPATGTLVCLGNGRGVGQHFFRIVEIGNPNRFRIADCHGGCLHVLHLSHIRRVGCVLRDSIRQQTAVFHWLDLRFCRHL